MGIVLGRKPEHETLCFPCRVAAAGDERYLLCAAGAAGVVVVHACVVLCLYAFLESVLADRSVLAA